MAASHGPHSAESRQLRTLPELVHAGAGELGLVACRCSSSRSSSRPCLALSVAARRLLRAAEWLLPAGGSLPESPKCLQGQRPRGRLLSPSRLRGSRDPCGDVASAGGAAVGTPCAKAGAEARVGIDDYASAPR